MSRSRGIGDALFMQPAVSQGALGDAVGTHPPVPVATSLRSLPQAYCGPSRLRLGSGVGFGWSLVHISMTGPPTGDLHPVYNAPMLGAHNALDRTVIRCASHWRSRRPFCRRHER